MAIRINNITLNLDDSEEILEKKVCKKLKIDKNDINKLIIIKKSIDARKKHDIKFNYCLDVICDKEKKFFQKYMIRTLNLKK